MSNLPRRLSYILGEEIYQRKDVHLVKDALVKLGVNPSPAFKEFYNQYAGPFWEEHIPFELLDLAEEENNIKSYTFICRKEHGFPDRFLVLSEMSASAVLVLEATTDKVYHVNFEGGQERLLQGDLAETWLTFYAFLEDYFEC